MWHLNDEAVKREQAAIRKAFRGAARTAKIEELTESWINGNRSYVRKEAAKMKRDQFALLVLAIRERDGEEQAQKFLGGF